VSHTSTRIMHRLAMVLMTVTLTVLRDVISHNDAYQAPPVTGSTAVPPTTTPNEGRHAATYARMPTEGQEGLVDSYTA
jgi:hypothetical protein